jgi:hypothetical protein
LHQSGVEHRACALQWLLGRLEDEHQPATYRLRASSQCSGDADADRGVQVVAAQVRDTGDPRGEALVVGSVRPREAQHIPFRVDGVHVRPVCHRRAVRGTVEHRDNSVPPDARRHLEPCGAQLLRDQAGRFPLLAGELGAAVDLPAELDQLVVL